MDRTHRGSPMRPKSWWERARRRPLCCLEEITMTQFYGKYEGVVDQNLDPLGKGRLLVKVRTVFRDGKVWAEPCVPYAGPDVGFFMMPPTDSHVWIEFAG